MLESFFLLLSTVFLNYLSRETIPYLKYSCFIVQEHRPVTNLPRNSTQRSSKTTLYSERYQPSPSPQNLSWDHNFCRNLTCLLSLFSHSKLIESYTPGIQGWLRQYEILSMGQKATHLRFCQVLPDGEMP